jgi:hypothetical protein
MVFKPHQSFTVLVLILVTDMLCTLILSYNSNNTFSVFTEQTYLELCAFSRVNHKGVSMSDMTPTHMVPITIFLNYYRCLCIRVESVSLLVLHRYTGKPRYQRYLRIDAKLVHFKFKFPRYHY